MEQRDIDRLIVGGSVKTKPKAKTLRKILAEALAANPDEKGQGELQVVVIKRIRQALESPDHRVAMQAASFLLDQTEGPTTRVQASLALVKEGVKLEILAVGGGEAPAEASEDHAQIEAFHEEQQALPEANHDGQA